MSDKPSEARLDALSEFVRRAVTDVAVAALRNAPTSAEHDAIVAGLLAATVACYLASRPDNYTEQDCVSDFSKATQHYMNEFFKRPEATFPRGPS